MCVFEIQGLLVLVVSRIIPPCLPWAFIESLDRMPTYYTQTELILGWDYLTYMYESQAPKLF